jgi:hypothetical protein
VSFRSTIALTTVPVAVALVALVAASGPVTSATTVAPAADEGHACSPSVSIESFSDALDKTTFDNTFVGNFSALAVDPDGSIDALADRSSLFTLDPRTKKPTRVVPLADENGKPLDSEGIAIERNGTRLITSEVEPTVRLYTRDGHLLSRLPVPDALRVAPAGRSTTNLTFEGLTLQPGDRTLIASMEGPLSGDDPDLRRFQTWTRPDTTSSFALAAQYGYRADPGLGISDIAATGDGRLLVLERGFTAGVGNTVRLYLADPRGSTDVSGVQDLTPQTKARLIGKTLLADLVKCPTLGATNKEPQTNPLLDNIEGIAVTRHEGAGRLRLLLVSDDNQSTMQTTRLYSLTATLPKS